MKVVYNSKEVSGLFNTYSEHTKKPIVNNYSIDGDLTTGDLEIYSTNNVDNQIASNRSVKILEELPTTTIKNTQYYIGPDEEDRYHVYLYDDDNVQIDMGYSDAKFLKAGEGTRIDSNNGVSINNGDFINITDDNKLTIPVCSSLSGNSPTNVDHNYLLTADSIYNWIFTGTTKKTLQYIAGTKGIVPDPAAGDQNKLLIGSCQWRTPTARSTGGVQYDETKGYSHKNSVTAKTSAGYAKIAYDAQGHITSSTALSCVNNLTSTSTANMLSANQGKVLNSKFDSYIRTADIRTTFLFKETDKCICANLGKYLQSKIDELSSPDEHLELNRVKAGILEGDSMYIYADEFQNVDRVNYMSIYLWSKGSTTSDTKSCHYTVDGWANKVKRLYYVGYYKLILSKMYGAATVTVQKGSDGFIESIKIVNNDTNNYTPVNYMIFYW